MLTKIINIYILLSIIIVTSLNEKNSALEFCDINLYCNSCTICGNGTNKYTLCSYYNLFCTEKFSNRVNFQEPYLEKYSKSFRNITNANEFCGQEMYNLDSVRNSFSIINKSNKNIQNSNINHCNYEIRNTKYFHNQKDIANLIINFNRNNSGNNNLKFIFNIFLQNSHSKSSKLIGINEINLFKKRYNITLNDYDKIIILLDFYVDRKNNSIDEFFEIKIDTNNPGNKNDALENIIVSIIITVLGFLLLALTNFVYYKRSQIQYIQIQNEISQQEELKRKQREEKINKLFETILLAKEFNEKDVINDCTECIICLEKFIDKCLICITPCKHIFHYECLSNYIEVIKRKQKPIIKCPLCNYDFLEEKNKVKILNEINNVNNGHIEVNNNQNNINENNAIENNINESNNNENNVRQSNLMIMPRSNVATSEENLREYI